MSRMIFLFVIFLFCILIVLWINFNLFPLFETSYVEYYEINNLITTIALSYITSFIFYFIIVYLKELKDKKNSEKFVKRKVVEIINGANHIRKTVESIGDDEFKTFVPDAILLRDKLIKINLVDDAHQQRLYPFTYEQLFKEHSTETRVIIDRILILLPFLDSKFVSTLNEIYECGFFNISTKLAPVRLINELMKKNGVLNNATIHTDPLIEYLKLIERLGKISP